MKYLILFALCTSCINPLLAPSEMLRDTVHRDYIKYLNNDPSPSNKEAKLRALKSYHELLEVERERAK